MHARYIHIPWAGGDHHPAAFWPTAEYMVGSESRAASLLEATTLGRRSVLVHVPGLR